ncbi:MAG TPA: GNAT family N-acetyltransferase [Tepidisphaeraceae bacterium]|nr:GNAT family N-acetyltransferase [Tepidisphaeraceae bacterium]
MTFPNVTYSMNDSHPIPRLPTSDGFVSVAPREQLQQIPAWRQAFANQRKDRRYYEIVEDTIVQGFEYRYFVLEDKAGQVRAVQPFFLLRQDILQGAGPRVLKIVNGIRKKLPWFLTLRTLMVGCAAGEGHLDHASDEQAQWVAAQLHEALGRYARQARVSMIVLKEFPAAYREPMQAFAGNGYTRVPSLPSVKIHLPFEDFEQYMTQALSKATRKDLRRKFRDADDAGISMEVLTDVTGVIDELYPLYLQVFEKSKLQFEKLTKEFFCRLGKEMPDKARFFVWRKDGRAIAFSACLLNGDELHDEYVGLDYSVALELHLYFYTLRDILQWAMKNGCKWYCSSGQGYEPKLRLKARLVPLDLYVSHTWPLANLVLRKVLPLIEPTRNDKTIAEFPNSSEIWG